jgi:hypothetical protein
MPGSQDAGLVFPDNWRLIRISGNYSKVPNEVVAFF